MAVWGALYVSDYSLTLACARLYRARVSDKIVFEGSYEITPHFQSDIDSLRIFSPRFVGALLLGGAWLVLVWRLSVESQPGLFQFVLGAMIASQLAVHVRHLRNLSLFRLIAYTDTIRGRIEYSRSSMLQMSSIELLAFSGLYVLLFVFTQSWFVVGGAVACLSIALKHWRLSRTHVSGAVPQISAK